MTDTTSIADRVQELFKERYTVSPTVTARAPGRVNLIGEHTDYNDGFVLPMAIDRAVYFAARARTDRVVNLYFQDFDTFQTFDLDDIQKDTSSPLEYVKGIAHFLEMEDTRLPGLDGVITGDIPISAGLSSSAALELAAARVYCALSGTSWEPVEMAKLAQRTENEWVGVKCGIMDQLISAAGRKDSALLIDCRSLQIEQTPLPETITVVVMDTGTRRSGHGLVDTAYSERRRQCEEAAHLLGIPALRDCSPEVLEAHKEELGPLVYRRARHVVTENERTLKVKELLASDNPEAAGKLMNQSHFSLQHDFEVSTHALDTMAEIARSNPACYGARMTGGGFGGCAVAIIQTRYTAEFIDNVSTAYENKMDIEPQLYACHAADGVSLLP